MLIQLPKEGQRVDQGSVDADESSAEDHCGWVVVVQLDATNVLPTPENVFRNAYRPPTLLTTSK
jgi:hypothetical protein